MKPSIDEFVSDMNQLLAFEYGDFKRKAGAYLNRLEEQLSSHEHRQKIAQIRQYLIFHPRYSIDEARERAIQDVQSLIT